MNADFHQALADLDELERLAPGRPAWSPEWDSACSWLADRARAVGAGVEIDRAGNQWFTVSGGADAELVVGGYLDTGAHTGGALGLVAGLELLRRAADGETTASLKLVNWADGAGERFGRPFGASAAAGTLRDWFVAAELLDEGGSSLLETLQHRGIEPRLAYMASRLVRPIRTYIEFGFDDAGTNGPGHAASAAAGMERCRLIWSRAASGSDPQSGADRFAAELDGLLPPAAAGEAAAVEERPARSRQVGALVQEFEASSNDADALEQLLGTALDLSDRIGEEGGLRVEWQRVWRTRPVSFDAALTKLTDQILGVTIDSSERSRPTRVQSPASELARGGTPSTLVLLREPDAASDSEANLAIAIRVLRGIRCACAARPSRPTISFRRALLARRPGNIRTEGNVDTHAPRSRVAAAKWNRPMETISFSGEGLAPELLPAEELADCAATAIANDGMRILSYGTGAGYTPLRELLADRLRVHPYRVVLTNGWLQGFALFAQAWARGRNIIVESPTFSRVPELLLRAGAGLVYLDRHEGGFSFEQLEHQLRTTQEVAFLYVTPTFQNPTGLSLSRDDRIQLTSMLADGPNRVVVLEDDSYAPLRFEGEPQPTLFELSGGLAVYSSSFSTTIAPGLRVGFFVLPQDDAGEFAARASATYISPALLSQATVFEFIQRGSFEPHLQALIARLKERRDLLLAALDAHTEGVFATRPEGGIHLLVRLPPDVNARAVLDRATGVTADAGDDFGGAPNTIRLNYAAPPLDQIAAGIEQLSTALIGAAPLPGLS